MDEPATSTVATEVFVMTTQPVLERLEALAQAAGDDGLDDLGDQLLPDLVDDGPARAWALDGYWREVGTVQAYWQAHREFPAETPRSGRTIPPGRCTPARAARPRRGWRGAPRSRTACCGGA